MFKEYRRKRKLEKAYKFNTSDFVTLPSKKYGHVFVFGSNLNGNHAGGAAMYARLFHEAQQGVAQGPTGNCYAIPTLDFEYKPINVEHIKGFINEFIKEAQANPNVTYHLTPIGSGIAGFNISSIAPMFANVPNNVILPLEYKLHMLNWYESYEDIIEERIKYGPRIS